MELYIQRELEKEIVPFLKRKEIVALVGARQVGKTTLLNFIFTTLQKQDKKIEFLTFEKEKDLRLFESIEDFKLLYKDYDIIIIDEFHYAKEGGKKLKYLFDTTKTKFIISGSSSLELTFSTGKFLVGRMLKFVLYAFSFREFLLAEDKKLHDILVERFPNILEKFNPREAFGTEINNRLRKHFENFLIFGGYPAVVLAKTETEKRKIIESILENYLLKDIKALLNLTTQRELLKISSFLASQIGNLLSYKELSNVSGLPYKNVLDHLGVLENTFVISLVKPFYRNSRTELVKTPKVYFLDTGFRNYLLSDFKKPQQRADMGCLVENFAFTSFKKNNIAKVNFWRTKSKAEVDFVLQDNKGAILPVEIKYSTTPSAGKSFYSFLEKFKPKKAYLLTKDFSDVKKIGQTQVYFAPVYYL